MRFRSGLHAFELITVAAVGAIVVYLRASGLRLDWKTVEYLAAHMAPLLPVALVFGLGLHLLSALLRWRSPLPWLRSVVRGASVLLWCRLWLATMITIYGYTWLKISVPLLNHSLWDAELWSLDRTLHFGLAPAVFAAELVSGTAIAHWLDLWYAMWIDSVLVVLAWGYLTSDLATRRHLAASFVVLALLCAWVYVAMPAVGPCYASPDVFAEIGREMPIARASQASLWSNYLQVVAGRDGVLRQFKPLLAVAAMPSLHVGAHWLFALWARRRARRLFLPFVLATALTFLGSLATGWHYAVDGYAGMLLAWAAVRIADRFEAVPPPAAPPGDPAEGGDGRERVSLPAASSPAAP